ncbi:uncharacterized protein LOC123514446 [Portunus trituberculatus]|uniref:uncharacterized protein LOC123514446 n=1 Tax=Portunus trituberculatus TaxID=210409 RepID=UPI001E1D0548|nr:uncharacterized protein LOC123514446 [Portunus trituberculatus]
MRHITHLSSGPSLPVNAFFSSPKLLRRALCVGDLPGSPFHCNTLLLVPRCSSVWSGLLGTLHWPRQCGSPAVQQMSALLTPLLQTDCREGKGHHRIRPHLTSLAVPQT